jgi:hypothetical protein
MRVDSVEWAAPARRPQGSSTLSQAQGAIAQLGERLVCNQKVAGSIPAGSTSTNYQPRRVMSHARIIESGDERMPHDMRVTKDSCVFFKNSAICFLTINIQP